MTTKYTQCPSMRLSGITLVAKKKNHATTLQVRTPSEDLSSCLCGALLVHGDPFSLQTALSVHCLRTCISSVSPLSPGWYSSTAGCCRKKTMTVSICRVRRQIYVYRDGDCMRALKRSFTSEGRGRGGGRGSGSSGDRASLEETDRPFWSEFDPAHHVVLAGRQHFVYSVGEVCRVSWRWIREGFPPFSCCPRHLSKAAVPSTTLSSTCECLSASGYSQSLCAGCGASGWLADE